jgi:hypothetical protein
MRVSTVDCPEAPSMVFNCSVTTFSALWLIVQSLLHNPIEHRLFPHITRACQGVVFHTLDIVKQFMEKAKTTTGLKVKVDILAGIYETGKKCAADFIENMRIVFDDCLPRWNYRALPRS